jgi:hypothetical protein
MVVPTVTGIDNLDNIQDSEFPLEYVPFYKGIPLYIKNGRIYITGYDIEVGNYQLIEDLKKLRNITHKVGFVIHLTINCGQYETPHLIPILLSHYLNLPEYTLYFTEVVIRHSFEKMKLDSRDANLQVLIEYNKEGKSNWVVNRPVVVATPRELFEWIEPQLIVDPNISGVTLYKPNAKYHCDFGLTEESLEVVNVDLLREEVFQIINIKSELHKYNRKDTANLATELIVVKDTSMYSIDLSEFDLPFRKSIWDKRNHLFGSEVKCEILTLPNATSPVIKRILLLGEDF